MERDKSSQPGTSKAGADDWLKGTNWNWAKDACFVCRYNDRLLTRRFPKKAAKVGRMRKCDNAYCAVLFHEQCFLEFNEGDFLPEMHVLDADKEPCLEPLKEGRYWYCPQHECNACHQELLRTRSQLGAVISCFYCILAWHRSCIPIGSVHVDRDKDVCFVCPRHNDRPKKVKLHTSYCVKCELKLDSLAVKCDTCIRSFCRKCFQQDIKGDAGSRGETTIICGSCRYFDYPRVKDYVLAVFKGRLFPAKALHNDEVPISLIRSNRNFVYRATTPGNVLIEWVEGKNEDEIPHFAVVLPRHVVPMPKTLSCSVWDDFRDDRDQAVYRAVEDLYIYHKIQYHLDRPMPKEVLMLDRPSYEAVAKNRHRYKACLEGGDPAGPCRCKPDDNGMRCFSSGCLNRALMTECPENCGRSPVTKKVGCMLSCRANYGKCANSFLRNYCQKREKEFMVERLTPNKGFGVFATRDISKGKDVAEFLGVVVPKEYYLQKQEIRSKLHHNLEMSYFGAILTKKYYLDGRNYGGMGRTMNHSCDPNCKLEMITVDGLNRLKIVSIKNIVSGDELTFDYNTEVPKGLQPTECLCGSANCRKFIEQPSSAKRAHAFEAVAGDEKENKAPDVLMSFTSFKPFTISTNARRRKRKRRA